MANGKDSNSERKRQLLKYMLLVPLPDLFPQGVCPFSRYTESGTRPYNCPLHQSQGCESPGPLLQRGMSSVVLFILLGLLWVRLKPSLPEDSSSLSFFCCPSWCPSSLHPVSTPSRKHMLLDPHLSFASRESRPKTSQSHAAGSL